LTKKSLFAKLGKMKTKNIFFSVLGDLSINLSAGWFGTAFIVPAISQKPILINFVTLTVDFILGMVFLIIAFRLKEKGEKYGHY
jgi:hypothetical protein